ncbi:MAG: AAA family ATPase [Conexivisphaerales archaeon]
MIEEVELENFISHRHTMLKLRQGISVFIGHNGAGKSSVIDGVTFALYGKHMRGDENRNLVRRGASFASVSLRFKVAGKSYLVERKIDAKGRLVSGVLKEIADDGSIRQLAAGERKQMEESMTDEIRKITGMSFDMMEIATIVQQGELDSIVTEYRPSDMKNLINEVIGIERLDKAYHAMKDALDGFKVRLRERYQNYDTDSIDSLQLKIEEDEKQINDLKGKLSKLEIELEDIQQEERELAELINKLEQMKTQVEHAKSLTRNLRVYVEETRKKMKQEEEDLNSKIPKAKRFLKDILAKEKVESELSSLREEEMECDKELTTLKEKSAEIKAIKPEKMGEEISLLRRRLEKSSMKIEELSTKIERLRQVKKPGERQELESRREELTKREQKIRSELGAIDEKISDYQILKEQGVCPVCDSQISPENVEIKLKAKVEEKEIKQRELDAISKELQNVETALEQLREYEDAQERLQDYERQFEDASSEKEQIEKDLQEKEKALLDAKNRLEELNSLDAKMKELSDRLKQIKAREKELQDEQRAIAVAESFLNENKISGIDDVLKMEKRLDELKIALKGIPDDIHAADIKALSIDDYSSSLVTQIASLLEQTKDYDEKKYSQARNRYDLEIVPELTKLREERGGIRSSISKLEEEVQTLSAYKKELERASEYISVYEKIRQEVYNRDGILATSLRSWALKQISRKASEYIRAFGIGISQVEFREGKREVNIICYGEAGEISVDSMSGGEKVAIALALRFAIADLIGKGKVDFIVFDEPTTHLDEERRKSLVRLVTQIGSGEGHSALRQIIIITHDEEIFEDSEVGTIYRFENTADGTRVSEVNR